MTSPEDADRIRRLERRLERARAARRESERIAETALRRLYTANELKTVLLGTVNHELRTPATVVKGFAQLLDAQWEALDEGHRRELVRRMLESSTRLADLVEEVLGLAGLEAGAMDGHVEDVDLEEVVAAVVAEEAGGADVRHDLRLRRVVAHPPSVRRILANLLRNAVTYGEPGAPVLVSSRRDGSHAELRVADSGPGIPPDERAHVFEPFFRGRGDHVLQTSGLGIGLTVVQRLVDLHDGEVLVEDQPDGGVGLVVRLPVEPVSAPGDLVAGAG